LEAIHELCIRTETEEVFLQEQEERERERERERRDETLPIRRDCGAQ